MNKIGVSVLFLTLFYGFFEDRADAQWTSYLNSHTVNQIAAQDSFIWCATTGAVARFHKLDTTFTKFTNVDGLADNKVQALSIDSSGNLWFVHEDSEVSVFDGVNQWNYFIDLDGIPGNGLSIATQGNRVWVGTDDGVWQLDTGGNPFDSDLAGCPFLNDTVIQAIVVKDTLLWFGTPNGICETSTDSLDICQILYTTADGLPSNVIQVIIIVGDTLWTGTINGIARKEISDSIWTPVTNSGLPSTNVRALAWGNDTFWAGTAGGVAKWTGLGWFMVNTGLQSLDIRSIIVDNTDMVWVGTGGKGIAKLVGSTWHPYLSKDMAHNWVVEVAVDLDGSVWCAHYPKSRQVSHLRLDGEWEIFDAESLWGVTTGFPRSIAVDRYGNKWIGIWGGYDGGTQIIKIESDTFKTFRLPTNSEAVGTVEIDFQNNKWFSGLGIISTDYVVRLSADDSNWSPSYTKQVKTDGILTIAIDHIGVKWLGGSSVHRFDDGGTPEDESDDQWRTFSEGNGLPSDAIFDLEVDRWNNVWVATRGGAAVIQYDTLFSQGEVSPYRTDDRGNLLGIVANIAFDVDGGVWFQTENIGLARRGPDGRWDSWTETDGLVSEDIASGEIRALDVNLKTGEVWIGTAHGLSRYQSSFFPMPDIEQIEVFPNPFIPSKGHPFITFKNVPPDATIHIYTLAGELIQELKERGLSLVKWDGLTDRMEEAVSGLYLFTVKDPQGGKRVGKFVIIR